MSLIDMGIGFIIGSEEAKADRKTKVIYRTPLSKAQIKQKDLLRKIQLEHKRLLYKMKWIPVKKYFSPNFAKNDRQKLKKQGFETRYSRGFPLDTLYKRKPIPKMR